MVRAAITNYRRGKISQGASTVTQQLARNSFELRERTYQRKLVEMFLAHRIEQRFSKGQDHGAVSESRLFWQRILWRGSGGAGLFWEQREGSHQSVNARCLAGLLRSPQLLSPWNNKEGATLARNFVLKRMKEQGFLSGAEYKEQAACPST